MAQLNHNDFAFLPLGGSNEIGMNVNLYHYKGKWLMIDLGAGFADEYFPGVSMLAPDLSFLYKRLDNFLGIVLTHAHEDHLGSVGYLWDSLRCPIYATPFTAGLVKHKLAQEGLEKEATINIITPKQRLNIGPFDLEMVHLTHSIPEMNAILIRTEHGTVVHTGDWKFDPNPVIGESSDFDALKKIGDEGVLAMVCDSTNVFNQSYSGSEGDLLGSLSELMANKKGLVVVTTFASNVARIDTIARAAQANGRKVVLAGWSLRRITNIAKDCGYLKDIEFIADTEMKRFPRKELVVIATGCQGEPGAAMHKILYGEHPVIRLTPQDTVIFSSKVIPGNEKRIFRMFNNLVRHNINVLTEKNHFVHVSGHPSRAELQKMYELVRPKIAIPVHGEAVHLHEHVKFAKSLGVPQTVEIQNGEMIRLTAEKAEKLVQVTTGYLAVDGYMLQPEKGEVMRLRRRLKHEGAVFISMAMTQNGKIVGRPKVSTPGVLDEAEHREFLEALEKELVEVLDFQRDKGKENIEKSTRKFVRNMMRDETNKNPHLVIHIQRA